jgi:lipoprotein-anchoring transpeptidase ErfK/SrfK
MRRFAGECCFHVIYFVCEIFFSPLIERVRRPRVETNRLTRMVKTVWRTGVLRGSNHVDGRDRRTRGESGEESMSMRRVVAVAATIGLGILTGNAAEARPEMVGVRSADFSPGTIVVRTNERRLYLIIDQEHAMRYPVGVGKNGKQWAGTTKIDGKYKNPAWAPPAEVKRDKPSIPDVIAGGSPQNPMGVAAMTLAGGEYAIHGTNVPHSVGGFVSYGCIRMLNDDITDLYDRVPVGTTVVVTR